MTSDDLTRTCLHELGHAQVALAFGYEMRGLTVEGGVAALGCNLFRPPDWPEETMRHYAAPFRSYLRDSLASIYLAGDLAVLMLWQEPGRDEPAPDRVLSLAAEIDAAPPPEPSVVQELREVVNDEQVIRSDDDKLTDLLLQTAAVHGGDLAVAGAWLAYREQVTRNIIRLNATRICEMAGLVAEYRTLGGQQAAAVLDAGRG